MDDSLDYDPAARERWVPEPGKRPGRTDFERDRARVLHSSALRRLAAKTQVVVPGESDFPRTRLTHSLECAQVGRELGRALGADPDLVETACLAHDLGHPPFGHNGEAALDEAAAGCGGFEGNAQSLRLLTRLEPKTFAPDSAGSPDTAAPLAGRSVGLNLTRATLDAATKYPWVRDGRAKYGAYAADVEVFGWVRGGASPGRPCLEAQIMDWADDVAYSAHDLEDAVHAGHLSLPRLRHRAERDEVAALCAARCPGTSVEEARAALERLLGLACWPADVDRSLRGLAALKDLTSQLIGRFAQAAETATRAAHGDGPLRRYAGNLVVPREARLECDVLKTLAARYAMSGEAVLRRYARQREVVLALVDRLWARAPADLDPALSPEFLAAGTDTDRLRVVIDQVALLTDPSALALLRKLSRKSRSVAPL